MKRVIIILTIILFSNSLLAQVVINTTNPEGVLDVVSTNDTGIVLPRVSSVESVTDGNGNPPVDGTLVFDMSIGMPCVYTNDKWACFGFDTATGDAVVFDGTPPPFSTNYFKASNTGSSDQFGNNVVLSADGLTMAISAPRERSDATGINGDQTDNTLLRAGAVYLFEE